MTLLQARKNWLWLFFALIVFSNLILYSTSFGHSIVMIEPNGVVLGSLIDLIIVAPLVFILAKKKYSVKLFIALMAIGCVLARFIIPQTILAPYASFTWFGIVAEVIIITFELLLISSFIIYLPKILKSTRSNNAPLLFSFPQAIDLHVKRHPLIHVLCSELLMFYYALFSWRKKVPTGYTLHKKTSYIAFQLMMIHAIIIETLGIHWWLHSKYPIASIILFVLNVYSVLFFLADLQAVRLNPTQIRNGTLYLSLGLMKRAKIPLTQISEIVTDARQFEEKLPKDIAQFIAKDFEAVKPSVILHCKSPIAVILPFGIEKYYDKIAIKVDDTPVFIEALKK
ncbi:beta-carotene 15,15'-monooxygenase [Metasolibacillus meyeri]|uniref:Beta-carotene 15,15'-monooxygenase n=1 Tax=Metasolibacillus meyeri TaxID=1071052 RepID=A0AAW9NTA4_9BACL|nr:beta-carotene 15,15'-monooxygenase [Metasolibacillus meyeri]MEC1178171.1 beta-carotene 15,15'-monooxygenase [Metasolibacillus meyeri]